MVSQLVICAGSTKRYTKDVSAYQQELKEAQATLAKLEKDVSEKTADYNDDTPYRVKQEKQNVDITQKALIKVTGDLSGSVESLETELAMAEATPGEHTEEQIKGFKEVLESARTTLTQAETANAAT